MQHDNHRSELFGVKIYDINPKGAKISKKDMLMVELVTDIETKKKAEALQQLLDQVTEDERIPWKL